MTINCSRAESRLKASRAMLAKDPENTALAGRVHNQELALADQEKAYPQKLLSHLRRMAQSHNIDQKGRTKKIATDLMKGIKPPLKPGEIAS
jgi:putative aminopeptidase FrvX